MVISTKYYEILGVAPNADAQAIRKAYKKRALQLHPDKGTGDPEQVRTNGWVVCALFMGMEWTAVLALGRAADAPAADHPCLDTALLSPKRNENRESTPAPTRGLRRAFMPLLKSSCLHD